ncbi:circularly permuted type 2 ATP-grasp protein [uncultured Phenylobacterium sp.]|uniref:circularly permuted type 2 ATP-grasp protein n=1 Tax=uncultured Phenylobacterium sp. TaxID=349273 RepID=UPI0025F5B115|nr:circularly permuted type 2 ATP-grasp protein [uncultured Phenylobacterium sp.]
MAAETSTAVQRRADLEPTAAHRLSGWLKGYHPLRGVPDELFDPGRRPRDHWLAFLGDFAEYPEADFKTRFGLANRHIRDSGASYRIYGEENERTWPLNPLPLILDQKEWEEIAAGVTQRAELVEALLQDIYGEGRLLAEGALPAAALTGSIDFLRAMRGVKPPGGRYMGVYAADLGRGPDGRWWVLDDRTQAPSGAGYALENRLVLSRAYPNLYNAMNVHRLAPFFDGLRRGLSEAAEREDPRICVLSPGRFSETYFEQAHLARYLGFLLVEGDDLVAREGKVYVRTIAGLKRADAILRRVDADFLDPLELNSQSRLGTPGMLEAIRQGGVTVLNMPGSGVIESKALLGFLPRLCRRLLGEDLKMPNIATWWCGQPGEHERVLREFDNLALGPAFNGIQGAGLTASKLTSDMTPEERDGVRSRMADRPVDFVGQEVVQLSTMPVLRDGRLEPAPFVLRVFAAFTPEGIKIMPGGFCRTSDRLDVRAISMGEGANTADVWVIDDKPVERISLMASREDVKVRRILGHLPSRAADNLFWLGRYLERTEATLRLVRALCTSLMDAEGAVSATGDSYDHLQHVLIDWGALEKDAAGSSTAVAARDALLKTSSWGSVVSLVRSAQRTASSMRERLSADFWALLLDLEGTLANRTEAITSEAQALRHVEAALRVVAALSGMTQENMNRVAGWRFLDMGRRIERGVNTCQLTRLLAHDDATTDDLDLLLDLADSQISYRARYLVGLALGPVRDMVMLDPYNTRSLAFQVEALKEHLAVLPTLHEDGMLEAPGRILLPLAAQVETIDAAALNAAKVEELEEALMAFSGAIGDRFFLQGATAVPTVKLMGLA